MVTTRYVKFRNWSGVMLRGKALFKPDSPPYEWDVIFNAVSDPEGGAYDTFISYDGTGVTWGAFQWTATSERLQKLMKFLDDHDLYEDYPADIALESLGLDFDPEKSVFTDNGKVVRGKAALRELLTPPKGQVLRQGKLRKHADVIAEGFWKWGQIAEVAQLQEEFFRNELAKEATYSRPQMKGLSIKFYLYPGIDVPEFWTPITDYHLTATRALFWSFWQNEPRTAERYLHQHYQGLSYIGNGDLYSLAKKFAYSTFAFWGNPKCASLQPKRESRYSKVAKAINVLIGDKLEKPLDPNLGL